VSPEATLLDLIANTLGIDADELTPDARFDELGLTSAQELELYVQIEDQLAVTLDFTEFSLLATVGEVVDAVWRTLPTAAT